MKPLEFIGVLVGLAGLGVGAYALFRRQAPALPPPPAAQSGQPAGYSNQGPPAGWTGSWGYSVPPGTNTGGTRPGSTPPPASPEQVIGQVAAGAVAVASTVASIIDLFN